MNLKDMPEKPGKLSVDDKLFLDKFKVDSENPHLEINDKEICRKCDTKDCVYVCPVGNYKNGSNGEISVSWEGCLECGSCRFACSRNAINWNYPRGGYGIKYRYG